MNNIVIGLTICLPRQLETSKKALSKDVFKSLAA